MKTFNQRGGSSGGFRSDKRSFGRPSFGGKGQFGRGTVTMHKATCAECNEVCEVPFIPSGDKPVYCTKCFSSKREGGERGPRKDFGRPSFVKSSSYRGQDQSGGNDDVKRQLETISAKLDQLVRAVENLAKNKEVKEEKISVVSTKAEAKPAKKKAAVKKTKKS